MLLSDFAQRFKIRNIHTGKPSQMWITPAMKTWLDNAFINEATPKQPTLGLFLTKAAGKSSFAAMIALWRALSLQDSELGIISPSRESGVGRVYKQLTYALKHDPALGALATIGRDRVSFKNGSAIMVYGRNSEAVAGGNSSWIFDEAWSLTSQDDNLRFDEASVRPNSTEFKLVLSYAGISGISQKLKTLWDLGLQGKCLSPDYGIFENETAGLLVAFDTEDFGYPYRLPHTDTAALLREESQMSPSTYQRVYLNRWANASGTPLVSEPDWMSMFDASLEMVSL